MRNDQTGTRRRVIAPPRKDVVHSIRFGSKEMDVIRQAAALMDTSVAALVAQSASDAARKIVLKHGARCPHCGARRVR
jgi:uncharacterized protein (DUF1778 family)